MQGIFGCHRFRVRRLARPWLVTAARGAPSGTRARAFEGRGGALFLCIDCAIAPLGGNGSWVLRTMVPVMIMILTA